MFPYYIFLAIVLLLAYWAFRGKKPNYVGLLLLFVVMSLFAGFRSSRVGTDSSSYAYGFENASYEDRQFEHSLDWLTSEPGFYYLEKFLGDISHEYAMLFTGIAMFFCFFVIWSIRKNSLAPVFSLFIFISLGYYTFVFNAARQSIAMAIYMMAIQFLIQRRFWPYLTIVLIAALFHKTIIVAIPLYFVFTMKYSNRTLLFVILFSLLVGWMLPRFLSFGASLEDRYALYTEGSDTGGYFLTLFYVIMAVFFILQRKHMCRDSLPRYDVFLLMLIMGSAIYLVVSLTGSYVELTRFAAYFQIGTVFLWAMIIRDRQTPISPLVLVITVIGHLGFFAIFLSRMAHLTPYIFNPNILA